MNQMDSFLPQSDTKYNNIFNGVHYTDYSLSCVKQTNIATLHGWLLGYDAKKNKNPNLH